MIKSKQITIFDKDLIFQNLASYDRLGVVNIADIVDEAVNKWSVLVSLVIEKHAPTPLSAVSACDQPLTSRLQVGQRTHSRHEIGVKCNKVF